MAATMNENAFNKKAMGYIGGHARNVVNSLAGRPLEEVQPWFGEGGTLSEINNGVAPAEQQQPTNRQDAAVVALTGTPKIPSANAAQPLPQPEPDLQQSSRQSRETPIPVGKYGWKGTSESVNGNPTLVLGTPGTDNSGVGSWQPGSARPGNAVAALASNQRVAPQTVTTENAQSEPIRSPLEISHENWKNMSINQDARPMSPAEKALALIDNAPISRKLTPAERDQVLATRAANKAEIIAQLGGNLEVQNARNQGAFDEQAARGANTMAIAKIEATDRATGHAIDLQRLSGENAVNRARIGSETVNKQKGQMEIEQQQKINELNGRLLSSTDPKEQRSLHRQILAMHGKPDNQKFQIVTREEVDPNNPMSTLKTPYVVDQDNPGNAYPIGAGNQEIPGAPQDMKQRKVGQVYRMPAGYDATWDGKGWKPVAQR